VDLPPFGPVQETG